MKQNNWDALAAELIVDLHKRLAKSVQLTKSARYCAKRGQIEQAVHLLMDYEGPAYEAQELFKTILVLAQRTNRKRIDDNR